MLKILQRFFVLTLLVVTVCFISFTGYYYSRTSKHEPPAKVYNQLAVISSRVPNFETPTTGAHSILAPITGAPSIHAPITGAPSIHAPITGAPSIHAPITGAPSIHAPTTGAPPKEAPSTLAPLTGYIACDEMGQLGNNMFQYAGLLGLARRNRKIPFIQPHFRVAKFFKVTHVMSFDVSRKWTVVLEHSFGKFDTTLLNLTSGDIHFNGYLQSFKYFQNITEEIKKEFVFLDWVTKLASDCLESLKDVIGDRIPIGVHVRRRDKTYGKDMGSGDLVASDTYFRKAFDWMEAKYKNVVFLVATDDRSWCQTTLVDGARVVLLPPAIAEVHMRVLTMCRHVIMSVGTFGWWAGWFVSGDVGGDVIYYTRQFREGSERSRMFEATDFFPPNWIGIGD
ncbi:galactoside alpha-(1,2)-fucosyltransferase 2-like [Physella acuta]|uniref:galactoside alpha-(1,2)-fucosyltransferase 2-like n=1 Tax=Physella acuta TaxID=109671 RepID=UPI0027DD493E|nr:galactoside alpha-(1,2)-fucosyltransferase 2-like [Physella acuta]